ncbi:Phosphatidylinositol N-acetylglucosaminyltransferase subunit P-like Protein [Tribolium castaneum]|uniref:Phosphatidylinositol N-acetylglucosaminyltransferase subunit P-like Protein n=1 Tax=Tribolium castaneum TaxID=7070 RepID=D6WJV2_TRICA|nr:PREDICTED: phosphatidylinositol N-acetylglucosaminyltransferase subunit P [Tribolium castaneum]EFA04752.1 Phosphatidylinositol N-acetylglucosaminyltransferase subunit P-like Protein [Tribolium castaneum]|eukprot:XP_008194164.1 PREDICTED: phosphatidylinositol N-acetylglucosaminyltransferase subunit P [Tribolium castaneum]
MPEHTPAPTPSRAVYGFAMFLSFKTFFILYLAWAVLPEEWFKYVGITCLPQRYWAVAIPIFLLTVLAIFAFVIYPNLGLFMTPSVDDLRTIKDSTCVRENKTNLLSPKNSEIKCSCKNEDRCFKNFERNCGDYVSKAIPVLQDLNIWEVSDHLYFK